MKTQIKNEDLRVRRTKKLLSNGLIVLMKKKPFEKIAVCDICTEAMVHRATFYSHFSDKYDLLTYSIDEYMPLDKLEIYKDILNPSYLDQAVGNIISYISDNQKIYASIFKNNDTDIVSNKILALFEERFLNFFIEKSEMGGSLPAQPEFLASFFSGACLNVIKKWLDGDINLTTDELTKNLNTLLELSNIM